MNEAILFILIFMVGLLLEAAAAKIYYLATKSQYKEHHFTFSKYLFLLIIPILTFLILLNNKGLLVLQVFIIFALFGTALEYVLGFSYHKVIGERLWTYHKYSISRYTSFLSIPFWGMGGVLSLLIIRALT